MQTALDLGYRAGLLNGLHAVYLLEAGDLVLEAYFEGEDENWGRPLGQRSFGPNARHDIRSVTKSVTSLVYAIALDQGLVPAPDAPLLASFPEYPDLADNDRRRSWTVAHALNMTLGTSWNESLPYSDPRNSEIGMEIADDRYRFVLAHDPIDPPGTYWNYNGGATALIGALIERGTGKNLADYAQEVLFDPLGIGDAEWNAGRDGVHSAASGLRLTAPELARIGELVRQEGVWQGTQIVPQDWVTLISTPQITTAFGSEYSHFWWLTRQYARGSDTPLSMLHAAGNGGQRLYILPELDLTMVVFAGAYNRPDDWMTPTLVLQRIVLANV
ncbi:serine hydrolase [Thalassococcus sp. S3]|nr:serine hydrolase [Thalassococcus sp. S3]